MKTLIWTVVGLVVVGGIGVYALDRYEIATTPVLQTETAAPADNNTFGLNNNAPDAVATAPVNPASTSMAAAPVTSATPAPTPASTPAPASAPTTASGSLTCASIYPSATLGTLKQTTNDGPDGSSALECGYDFSNTSNIVTKVYYSSQENFQSGTSGWSSSACTSASVGSQSLLCTSSSHDEMLFVTSSGKYNIYVTILSFGSPLIPSQAQTLVAAAKEINTKIAAY